jgi:hypothetical protein
MHHNINFKKDVEEEQQRMSALLFKICVMAH